MLRMSPTSSIPEAFRMIHIVLSMDELDCCALDSTLVFRHDT